MTVLAYLVALDVAAGVVAATTEIDLLDRASELDTPALLLVFVWLLYKRKIVWAYQLDECAKREAEWKAAAGVRTLEQERAATIAEAAMRAAPRGRT